MKGNGMGMGNDPVDLGHGHVATWTSWAPDRELNPQWAHLPDVERSGLLIKHSTPEGNACMGGVVFDSAVMREVDPGTATWTVESEDPLTLSPSILCSCGDHGWIKDGRWVPA